MDYSVTAYFDADKNLKEAILEVDLLRQTARQQPLHEARKRMKIAADKVDELVEIFTWETSDTDHIRRAFIKLACGLEEQLTTIRNNGLFPDPCNGTNNPSQLVEDIKRVFCEALKSRGRFQPCIIIKTGSLEWKDEPLLAYVKNIQSHLKHATFDNLLEAVTYFEKSVLLLKLIVQPSGIQLLINNSII